MIAYRCARRTHWLSSVVSYFLGMLELFLKFDVDVDVDVVKWKVEQVAGGRDLRLAT